MRCTRCYRKYRSDDEDTLMPTVAEPICGPGAQGQPTEVQHVFLCPQCTSARRKTERLFLWMVLLAAGLVLVALIVRVMDLRGSARVGKSKEDLLFAGTFV